MSEIEKILAGVPSDAQGNVTLSDGATEEQQEKPAEAPAESPTETTEADKEAPPSDGAEPENNQNDTKPTPYHLDPRWQKIRSENEELRTTVQKMREDLEAKLASVPAAPRPPDEDFVKLFGEDPEAMRRWQNLQKKTADSIKEELRAEMRHEAEAEQKILQESHRYVDESLEALEAEGKKFDRNELMKFMIDFKEKYGALPSDDADNIDFHKGYELMMEMKAREVAVQKEKLDERKKLADFTTSPKTKGDSEKPKDYYTSADLHNKDFSTLVRE